MIAVFVASTVAFLISVSLTPFLIRLLRKKDVGQHIRDDGPIVHPHAGKAGTPTMGGIAIVIGLVVGYGVAHTRTDFVFGRIPLAIVGLMSLMAFVGLVDDYLGIVKKRNLGLRKRGKVVGQIAVASTFGYLSTQFLNLQTDISIFGVTLATPGPWVYGLFCAFIIIASANAVNITDGLDGLAAGSSILVFSAFTVIAYWQFRNFEIYSPGNLSFSSNSLDLAILCAAVAGGCAGFLWFNAAPAQIFMGDVGSLALGSAMAMVAISLKIELLLIVLGGIYVIETLSVIAQIVSYRVFKKRVLKMAPIHHHFEVLGWPETTIIVRFWLLSGIFVALGIGIFYADFVRATGLIG